MANFNFELTALLCVICCNAVYKLKEKWSLLQYPQLVYGAIASSAPVRAKVNFEGYHNVTTSSLGDPVVNGSFQVCHIICACA